LLFLLQQLPQSELAHVSAIKALNDLVTPLQVPRMLIYLFAHLEWKFNPFGSELSKKEMILVLQTMKRKRKSRGKVSERET
jgi:hypothetical protein